MVYAHRNIKRLLTTTPSRRAVTMHKRAAPAAIAQKLSDFKRFKAPFVEATAEAFWEAVEAGLLPGRRQEHKSRG